MELKRSGSQPTIDGSEASFSGRVRVTPLFPARESGHTSAASVTFEAGARSAWHTHPLGQNLIVTSGTGLTQCWGEKPVTIRAGDVIWCPPGHKHWHGASPGSSMTHIAIQDALDGKVVDWLEKVTDEQYAAAAAEAEQVTEG